MDFAVTLSSASSRTVTVSYRTSNGSASSSLDYTAVSGTLTFRSGETSKTISVRTTDDSRDESNETFTVRLSNANGATISDASATGTINDNDTPSDHGDSRTTADPLDGCGTSDRDWSRSAHLSNGDIDYFKIVCDYARGTLRAYTTGSTDTRGEIQYGDGSSESRLRDDNRGSGRNFRVERSGTIGTYYIKVDGASWSTTGSYVLKVEWRPYDAPDRERNSRQIGDFSIPGRPNGTNFSLHLSRNDEDWFVFRLAPFGGTRCSTVTIRSSIESRLSSDFTTRPRIRIKSETGSRYRDVFDENGQFNTSVSLYHGSRKFYYIRVTPYLNLESSTGPYTLQITRSTPRAGILTCLSIGAKG